VVTFSPFWAGKHGVCYCSPFFATASPRQNPKFFFKGKITKGRVPRMNNGRETIFRKGDGILGGKTKYSSRTGRHRPHRHDRVHPAGPGACQSTARLPNESKSKIRVGRGRASIRALTEPGRVRRICEGVAAVALWHYTARGAGAYGTRQVLLPGRRLHEDSPAGPGSPGSEHLRTRCVVLPEAILHVRNAHFAHNFRHHPGVGGHQTPSYVPIPVSKHPGAL
jgi:hypothetical protein